MQQRQGLKACIPNQYTRCENGIGRLTAEILPVGNPTRDIEKVSVEILGRTDDAAIWQPPP